jgi:hypothetical protein
MYVGILYMLKAVVKRVKIEIETISVTLELVKIVAICFLLFQLYH